MEVGESATKRLYAAKAVTGSVPQRRTTTA
jgi:hypothetical protein